METLKRKAAKYRNAINIAKKRGELDWHPMFRKFPNECCDLTCELLGQYLAEDGIMTHQINGVNKYDTTCRHVWLLTDDEQKERLMKLTSLNVSDLKNTPWPDDLKEILAYYLIKPADTTDNINEPFVQLSFVDDGDVVDIPDA